MRWNEDLTKAWASDEEADDYCISCGRSSRPASTGGERDEPLEAGWREVEAWICPEPIMDGEGRKLVLAQNRTLLALIRDDTKVRIRIPDSRVGHYAERWCSGIDILPYQFAMGWSIRWFDGGPSFRIYCGPLKIWGGFHAARHLPESKERDDGQ